MERRRRILARTRSSLDSHAGGFLVTHLTDHDDIRVLTQNMTQGIDKIHAFFRGHLHLADAA